MWMVREGPFGVRLFDVSVVALVIAVIEVNVIDGGGPGAGPLTGTAYLYGALLAVPIVFRHRWPFPVLIASAAAMLAYYLFARRNISPAPLFFVPLYDAAVVGYLAVAIAIPAVFMVIGLFVVEVSTRQGFAALTAEFLSQIVILALAVMLGEVVRSRRALTAETAQRLRLADTERAAAAGRVIAEERLRIARELHDTVAHSMATITVQAGAALGSRRGVEAETLRDTLTTIRETSKAALTDMRSVLGQLRHFDHAVGASGASGLGGWKGLADLEALRDAVTAAGARVEVDVEGQRIPLSAEVDHAAYRILQESLTNVLRHAGPAPAAQICLRYQPDVLVITVTDNGSGTAGPDAEGHGIGGMRERAAAVGGELTVGPRLSGGFQVRAALPALARAGTWGDAS